MPPRIDKNDVALVRDLADCRMLTLAQLAILRSRGEAGLGRRARTLVDENILQTLPAAPDRRRGRPQGVFGVDQRGFELLREKGVLSESLSFEQVSGEAIIPQAGPQILMNWCRVHLVHMTEAIPKLSVRFLSCNSPFALDTGRGTALIRDRVSMPDDEPGEERHLLPDAVFTVTDMEGDKTLLFFLEVDMGTEPITRSRQNAPAIADKIMNYQAYFRSGAFKRYEEMWSASLNGFRLLFLCSDSTRTRPLCQAVRSLPPSDFIWLTTQERMLTEGVSADIWVRGGRQENGLQSILGRLSQSAPIPSLLED